MKYLIILFILGLLTITESYAQCAMCRATVENNISSGESLVGAGLNNGILYLMLMPYILLGTIAYFWYKNSKAYTASREKLAGILKSRLT